MSEEEYRTRYGKCCVCGVVKELNTKIDGGVDYCPVCDKEQSYERVRIKSPLGSE